MTIKFPVVTEEGDLLLTSRVHIPAEEIEVRATTSQGPGGQHVNRTLSKIVVTYSVEHSSLNESDKAWLTEKLGPVVRTSASRFRSQRQNKQAALEQLAQRLATALVRPKTRRATRPSKSSKVKRVDAKRSRGEVKRLRRNIED
jgi:ribosome-associated protein